VAGAPVELGESLGIARLGVGIAAGATGGVDLRSPVDLGGERRVR
jgi:hypothetical protein